MADSTTPIAGQVPVADEETKFKTWLKEKYQIEDDPETFKTRRSTWTKAEEEIGQYQATLTALIQHVKDLEENSTKVAPKVEVDDDEERLRTVAKIDPYEGMKRYFGKFEKTLDEKLEALRNESGKVSEQAVVRRDTLRRSFDLVKENWPEALDKTTELHKMGRQIYQQEMSDWEKNDPRSFLIATERAAGRLGLPPASKRKRTNRVESVSAQGVSRDRVRPPADEDDDAPLNARQRQIAESMGVDPKVYKESLKRRKQQKKQDEE